MLFDTNIIRGASLKVRAFLAKPHIVREPAPVFEFQPAEGDNTDKDTINIVEDVLIKFNKEIVEALNELACKAKRITSKENNIITVVQENKDLGFVGTPTKINKELLIKTIKKNEVPVVAPLGSDKNNQTFNINADTAAGSIAIELKARRLIIMSDVEGVIDDNNELVSEMNSEKIHLYIEHDVIKGGMLPKILTCLDVASNGVKGVVVIDGRKNHSLLFELLSDKGSGTLIRE